MKKSFSFLLSILVTSISFSQSTNETTPVVTTANGMLQGTYSSGIKLFRGVPFAKPPVGDLRWREPQSIANWQGVRKADHFGPRAMQLPIFSDMMFRSDGVSEDCLYLNIWSPAKSATEKLPVLVYFYGGGFRACDGSEFRYDGESMARKGIIAITVNYRLSIFGFFAHPELTKESPHHASGNYGLLDQAAAIKWVQQNIAAFGGDPKKITIAGESAGSFSVSAQMASPLSKNILAGAIGESGALLGVRPLTPLIEVEKMGEQFAETMGAKSLAALRALPAQQILEAAEKNNAPRFPVTIDGYFFTAQPFDVYTTGQQAKVPLLVGWNSEESNYKSVLGQDKPTVENYTNAVKRIFNEYGTQALKAYPVTTDADVEQVATSLGSNMFIGYGTWQWSDVQSKTSGKPVYRYLYARPRPITKTTMAKLLLAEADGTMKDTLSAAIKQAATHGANHSAEIEYALGNLPTNKVYDWQPEDYTVSEILQSYFVNFIKTGNPNGAALPVWPALEKDKPVKLMQIDVNTSVIPEANREGYLFFETMRTGYAMRQALQKK